jgi:hypothetical protein
VLFREDINPVAMKRTESRKEKIMSPAAAQEVASAVQVTAAPLAMLGTYQATFSFLPSTSSTRTASVTIQNPPPGVAVSTIALQSFDVEYTNQEQYGFGRLQINLNVGGTQATCTVTLRDNHTNERQWDGTVTGLVTFYGN